MKEIRYDDAQAAEHLRELPGWSAQGGWIRRTYETDGWPSTMLLVNAIAFVAEAAYHHPDLEVSWSKVVVKLQTHSAGGVTEKDVELARKIEVLATWRPSGGALEGTPHPFVKVNR